MSSRAAEERRLVFVGNLPIDIKEREVDDLFYKVCPPPSPGDAYVFLIPPSKPTPTLSSFSMGV
jgi:hypothetical protein